MFGVGLVMSTSFGIQSAVMLHLVTQFRPNIPVIWIDTGYLPAETYRFADELTTRLGLNLYVRAHPVVRRPPGCGLRPFSRPFRSVC